jgi:hypothetical protein
MIQSGSILSVFRQRLQWLRHLHPLGFYTVKPRFVLPEQGLARQPALIGGTGVAFDLFEAFVAAYRRDLVDGLAGVGESGQCRLAQAVERALGR